MKILVDMDGVLADFDGGFLKIWRTVYPDKPFIPLEQRTTFYIDEQYPPELKDVVCGVTIAPNFFRSLDLIDGGVEALNEMRKMGHEVFLCSSPLSRYQNCVLEKYQWVELNLGKEWVNRLILTRDKTLVKGDILIDDRPRIAGCDKACSEHILYDQPYNRCERSKKRLTWANWKSAMFS